MRLSRANVSSNTRRATGPRTFQGKERSKFNARKHGLFSKAVLLRDESRAEYDALLNGLMEDRQPQGKLEILQVENLATLLWRKRRFLQVETAEIEKKQFLNWDLELQNEFDHLEYAQLKDASDAKLGHSNPLLLLRNAIEILTIHRLSIMAGESGDDFRQILKSIYGYQNGRPEPYGWRQLSLMLSKLISATDLGQADSKDPAHIKQLVVEATDEEITRLTKLYETAAGVEALRGDLILAAARVPSQGVSDRLIRYDAHLSREIGRTLALLERLQRARLGQRVPPKLEVHHSLS